MIHFVEHKPPGFEGVIKNFWFMKVDDNLPAPFEENIIPDHHFEIIICCSSSPLQKNIDEKWVAEPKAFLIGQTTMPYNLRMPAGTVLFGIRIKPAAIRQFVSLPAFELTDKTIPLENFCHLNEILSLTDENHSKTFENFRAFFEKKICGSPGNPTYLSHALDQIFANNGDITIHSLLEETGISNKYLDTLFMNHVGVLPKSFCKILKLQQFIRYQTMRPGKKFTESAYEAGFYDQSHLIKTFTEYTGTTPRKYFSRPNLINSQFLDSSDFYNFS